MVRQFRSPAPFRASGGVSQPAPARGASLPVLVKLSSTAYTLIFGGPSARSTTKLLEPIQPGRPTTWVLQTAPALLSATAGIRRRQPISQAPERTSSALFPPVLVRREIITKSSHAARRPDVQLSP